jgi:CDP-diacylglycerol pyrophosphatase
LDKRVSYFAGSPIAVLLVIGTAHGAQRDQLRTIVQQRCVPHWLTTSNPAPCVSLHMLGDGPDAPGFAVLPDRKGGAHYLLIPTRSISGIESPDVRDPSAPNYFDAAWEARGVLNAAATRELRRAEVGVAVNSVHSRSQDQLHLHIECLGRALYNAIQTNADQIGYRWSAIKINGWHYQAIRVMGTGLGAQNPFEILAGQLPGAKDAMGDYTLLVAGANFGDGPGFVLLAGVGVPGAERLLDSRCRV